jgi:hypothetical protein
MSRAEEYRRLAQQCLDVARTIRDPDGHAALVQMAQVWQRLANEQESATSLWPTAAESAQPSAQQQQQIQPKDEDKNKKD